MISSELYLLLADKGFDFLGPFNGSYLVTTWLDDRYSFELYLPSDSDEKLIGGVRFYRRHRVDDEHTYDYQSDDYLINLNRRISKTLQEKIDRKFDLLNSLLYCYEKPWR